MDVDLEEASKRAVGRYAAETFVRDGTCIGLGTGSTAKYAVERVGQFVREGMHVRAVPTSLATERQCLEAGIPIVALCEETIDVAIDGADEVAITDWSLVKGGGGALFREKAVALATTSFVVVVTERKLVSRLGAFGIPVEVVPFSAKYVAREIEALGANVAFRRDESGKPLASDNGNALLDCDFGTLASPLVLDRILHDIHGVVSTGLFVGLTSHVLVAMNDGTMTTLTR